jgi:hypothetical protein
VGEPGGAVDAVDALPVTAEVRLVDQDHLRTENGGLRIVGGHDEATPIRANPRDRSLHLGAGPACVASDTEWERAGIGAGGRPNWRELPARESVTWAQWRQTAISVLGAAPAT